jgi:hypothetical protein
MSVRSGVDSLRRRYLPVRRERLSSRLLTGDPATCGARRGKEEERPGFEAPFHVNYLKLHDS